jgi:hypothetical protein
MFETVSAPLRGVSATLKKSRTSGTGVSVGGKGRENFGY